jgi:methanogenic corrinoid protein MtbC1
VGTVAPILVSLASSSGWTQTWIAAGGLILLEIVTNNIVEPWFYGGATGVSPLALLVSAAFWTWIWGPAGLVLSTPLTVCLIVVGKHVRSMRFVDVLFGDAPVMSKASRLYHRLLAGDSEEAWEIVRTESAHGSVLETADQVLMPALGFVDAARDDGRLDAEAHQAICTIVQGLVDELADLPREPVVDVPSSAARILCMGARSAFDSMGCRVLVQEYKRRGFDPKLAGAEVLLAEVGEMMRRDEVDLIVVSSVIPTQVLHVRSLCKRLLAVDSRAEILLGLWGEAASKEDLAQRLPSSPRLNVVTTMGATIAWTEAAAPRLVAQRSTRAAC